jgi:hypothetical protein
VNNSNDNESPCNDCILLAICINKHYVDILRQCELLLNYILSLFKKGNNKKLVIPFPMKYIEDGYTLQIRKKSESKGIEIICYESGDKGIEVK